MIFLLENVYVCLFFAAVGYSDGWICRNGFYSKPWANIVQYDNASRMLGFQTRFRWIIQPGSDLFLILNRGWEKSLDHRYISVYDQGTAKLQYTFRF